MGKWGQKDRGVEARRIALGVCRNDSAGSRARRQSCPTAGIDVILGFSKVARSGHR